MPRAIWPQLPGSTLLILINFLSMTALFFEGYNQGVMGGVNTVPNYIEKMSIGTNGIVTRATKQGGIVCIYYLGALFGCFWGGYLGDKRGRRFGVWAGTLWCVAGAALQASAQNSNWMLCARIITGVGTGHLNAIVPVWTAEISKSHSRGASISIVFLANYIGIAVAYWLEFGLRYYSNEPFRWRFPIAFQIVPAAILSVCIWLVPESPRWLVKAGHTSTAARVLAKIRGDVSPTAPEITEELAEIESSVSQESANAKATSLWAMAIGAHSGKLHTGRRVALSMGIMIMMEWTGILAITVYANTLFGQAGFDPTKSAWLAGLVNTVGILGTGAAALTIDRYGRRPSLFFGAVVQCIALALTGGMSRLAIVQPHNASAYGAASAAMVFIYTFFFAATWLQCAFVVPAEIFPTYMRAKGNSFGVAGWAIGCAWTTLVIPSMFKTLGERTLYLFAGLNLLWLPIVYCFYPETGGRSLESIDSLFASESPFVWDEEREFKMMVEQGMVKSEEEEKGGVVTVERAA
ncbi:putative MFS monosaccharide transporter [Saitoella complicata NRRL Y-17804]|nr:putative MFS monosaccharide transporter [Saitoella complicata NRRL Y-17804]ODQ50374.1 putative MFS monosaccharide transporter [Saitoella complicata NRRL Y-17804]